MSVTQESFYVPAWGLAPGFHEHLPPCSYESSVPCMHAQAAGISQAPVSEGVVGISIDLQAKS
eukprot:5587019-Karenia_brevis.AAC.1